MGTPLPARRSLGLSGVVAGFIITSIAAAQTDERPGPWRPGHLEVPSMPYLAPDPDAGLSPAVTVIEFNGFTHHQVNVAGGGFNIANDAANEPSIAVDPLAPNRLVIGWRQFDNINSSFRQAGRAYSHDGGRTWTFNGVFQPGVFRSDPVLGSSADGTLYYYSLRGNFLCDFFTSTDGGVTWAGPFPAWGGDKQWFIVDNTGGTGDGHIYANWSIFAGCCGQDTFIRSIDGAASFPAPITVPDMPVWGTLAVAPDGNLFVCGRDPQNAGNAIIARSINADDPDANPTFQFSQDVNLGGSFVFSAGPNPGGLLGQAWVAVNRSGGPNNGHVYMLASVNPPGPDPLSVFFTRSTENGLSWSPPVQVHPENTGIGGDGPQWQWFGTMDVAPNGRIDVVYNDTGVNANPDESALYYVFSDDDGLTWADPVQVSPAFNQHVGYPQQNKIGDYYHLIADDVGAHLAWAATFNGEQDVYHVRIGDYDCNVNGVGDAMDIDAGDSADCNDNGIPDECEIAAGTEPDDNDNGIPDACEGDCVEDLDEDGVVGPSDLAALLAAWATDPGGPPDFDGNGTVDAADLATLLAAWGPCDG